MKLRESGMTEEAYWETLLDVPLILDQLGIDDRLHGVVEFGCGYGTFSLPVARRIAGVLTTFDIDPAMVTRTQQRAAEAGITNIRCEVRDVFAAGFGVTLGSHNACLLFNTLHCKEPARVLMTAGIASNTLLTLAVLPVLYAMINRRIITAPLENFWQRTHGTTTTTQFIKCGLAKSHRDLRVGDRVLGLGHIVGSQ